MTRQRDCRSALSIVLGFAFLVLPLSGWAIEISDRPLFIEANLDHNLMFVVDDSGSMDYEVLAPAVGDMEEIVDGYVFDPGKEAGSYSQRDYAHGKRMIDEDDNINGMPDKIIFTTLPDYLYLRSADYNYQYYDPSADYEPWPSTSNRTYTDADITQAKLDAGLSDSNVVDLTGKNVLGVGENNIPATFFVTSEDVDLYKREITTEYAACDIGVVDPDDESQCVEEYTVEVCFLFSCWEEDRERYHERESVGTSFVDTKVAECSDPDHDNYYSSWRLNTDQYIYKDSGGDEIASRKVAIAPDGACLLRVELVNDEAGVNETEVLAVTGDSLAVQQQNFANWFSYYRRRHQAIRAAIGQSVVGLENMRLGVFWINHRRDMDTAMYSSNDYLGNFLDDSYSRFDNGEWTGAGTPNRLGLQHAGKEFSKQTVRGRLECRKNFTLLFTDGYSNNHNTSSIAADNADSAANAPFANSSYQDTLGDIAYYYYQGLRGAGGSKLTGGNVRTPAACEHADVNKWVDCNSNHHMNTYGISLGMLGENFAGHNYLKVKDAHDNPPDWGSSAMSSTDNPAQIDDLYHAAVNGKGEYYSARSTTDLVLALQSAVDDTKKELGSGSNVNFNTASLSEGGVVYSAEFTSLIWTGDLKAESINADGQVTNTLWSAADKLSARDLSTNPRLILTHGTTGGVSFAWDNLTTAQKADLSYGGGDQADTLGQKRLAYLAGADISEVNGVVFRDRELEGEQALLGPIINSSPQYVGSPGKNWPNRDPFGIEGERYSDFRTAKADRTEAVYVGANDGMLHGFNADTGEELLAYIPSFLFSAEAGEGLHALTQASYDYQSYADLPVAASDIYTGGAWRTILIGGARAAGPGLFALDVTDPSTFTAANAANTVLWEFTPEDDANLGNLTSAVQITLLDWGEGDYRWSAVFENGYGVSTNGLFVLDLSKPAGTAWSEGTNYEFIELASGTGLSPVRLVDYKTAAGGTGSDGIADRAYAGDREGRLWAINLTGGTDSWGSVYGESPLFQARDASLVVQPITSRPIAAYNEYETDNDQPNLIILFGTGQYLVSDDLTNTQVQSFYGINDRGVGGIERTEEFLVARELSEQVHPTAGVNTTVRKTDDAAIDWSTKYGWHVDFDTQEGERIVSGAQVQGDYVVFPTTIPVSDDECSAGGFSFVMALKLDGSTDSDRAIIDVNNDGELNELDEGWSGVGYGDAIITNTSILGDLVIGSGSDTSKPTFLTDLGGDGSEAIRASWREVVPR